MTRREFMARLRGELPAALRHIREGNVGPVDMAQAALGPGMGVFTACARVLEHDDSLMSVRTAIALINQVRDEISGAEAEGFDAATRFCIDWFEAFGMEAGSSGDAITMAQAYGLSLEDLRASGAFAAERGRARLRQRNEFAGDAGLAGGAAVWTCAQHLARVLNAQDGGLEAAARLLAGMGPEAGEGARLLAYRLYDLCDRKGLAAEAQLWNGLASEWPALEETLARIEAEAGVGTLALG